MCDFRKVLKVINKLTNEEYLEPISQGHIGGIWDLNEDSPVGLYHVGMSGCGYGWFDGQKIHTPYSLNTDYPFVFGEYQSPMGAYIDYV